MKINNRFNKILSFCLMIFLLSGIVFAGETDKYSKEYLQSKKHFSIMRPAAEKIVEKKLEKSLKKEYGGKFDVKFTGYSVSSMKKGIFKNLEITAKDIEKNEIPIPYLNLKSLTDYNYIDYEKNPIVFKSDMTYQYEMLLSEDSMNEALKQDQYNKIIKNVNKLAYPLFTARSVKTKLLNDEMYIIMDYNIPIAKSKKDKTFVMTTNIEVENGNIKAKNVHIDTAYGNLGLTKVTNLVNLLNPLDFTLKLMNSKNCNGNIENVKIIDNKIRVDGKIYIKGEK